MHHVLGSNTQAFSSCGELTTPELSSPEITVQGNGCNGMSKKKKGYSSQIFAVKKAEKNTRKREKEKGKKEEGRKKEEKKQRKGKERKAILL
jgi:sRNA-binding protein